MKSIESSYGESVLVRQDNGIEKWVKMETKYILEGDETEQDIYKKGSADIEKFLKGQYPEMYGEKVIEEKKVVLTGKISEDIKSVTDLKVLKTYEMFCRNNAELNAIYTNQLKLLSK